MVGRSVPRYTDRRSGEDAGNVTETSCFVFPVTGLYIEGLWSIGPVQLRPGGRGEAPPAEFPFDPDDVDPSKDLRRAVLEADTTADVTAANAGEALDLLRRALDVLRVFSKVATSTVRTIGQFGLPGELNSGVVPYVTMPTREFGFHHIGHFIGLELSAELREQWSKSEEFQFVASTLGRDNLSDGERRGVRAVALLGQSLRSERDTTLQYALTVFALDTLLGAGPRIKGGTYAVARRAIYFSCGHATGDPCGRGRDTCLNLALDPAGGRQNVKKLNGLRDSDDTWWLCTEWQQLVGWFDHRAAYVHRGEDERPTERGFAPDYWVYASLLTPILAWFRAHPDEPILALDAALNGLPEAPDWSARAAEQGHRPPW